MVPVVIHTVNNVYFLNIIGTLESLEMQGLINFRLRKLIKKADNLE